MAQLDRKYNLAKKRQLKTRESPRKLKKIGQILDCQRLGLGIEQYNRLSKGLKTSMEKQKTIANELEDNQVRLRN